MKLTNASFIEQCSIIENVLTRILVKTEIFSKEELKKLGGSNFGVDFSEKYLIEIRNIIKNFKNEEVVIIETEVVSNLKSAIFVTMNWYQFQEEQGFLVARSSIQ